MVPAKIQPNFDFPHVSFEKRGVSTGVPMSGTFFVVTEHIHQKHRLLGIYCVGRDPTQFVLVLPCSYVVKIVKIPSYNFSDELVEVFWVGCEYF